MKKSNIILGSLAGLIGLVGLSGCSDFLNTHPQGTNSSDQYFANDYQAVEALDGIYAFYHQEDCFGREFFWE